MRAIIIALAFTSVAAFAETLSRLSDVFTYMPSPRYPVDAWVRTSTGFQRGEGRVICRVTLNGDGAVVRVDITKSSGSKMLDHSATQALGQWRAKPGRLGRFYDIPVRFNGRDSTLEPPVPKDGLGLSRGKG
jgi:TonB family protein